MTETMMTETAPTSAPKKAASKPKKKPAKRKSAASSRPGSARKKKPGKRGKAVPKHWSKTHAQLVLHATPELVAKLDRKLKTLAKRLKCNPTRGAVVRALVTKAAA